MWSLSTSFKVETRPFPTISSLGIFSPSCLRDELHLGSYYLDFVHCVVADPEKATAAAHASEDDECTQLVEGLEVSWLQLPLCSASMTLGHGIVSLLLPSSSVCIFTICFRLEQVKNKKRRGSAALDEPEQTG
jgi:hypothetical protein